MYLRNNYNKTTIKIYKLTNPRNNLKSKNKTHLNTKKRVYNKQSKIKETSTLKKITIKK